MSQPAHVPLPPLPAGRVRPGIVTAIGVMSILVASVGLVGGLVSGMYVMGVQWFGRVSANQAQSRMAAALVAQQAAGTAGVPTPEDLEKEVAAEQAQLAGRRDALVDLLAGLHELSDEQRQQLSAALGRYADRVVPHTVLSGRLTATDVRDWVQRAGALPADAPGGDPPAFYRLASGELTVYADRAVFRPADGSGTLRSTARDGLVVDGLQAVDARPVADSPPEAPSPATATTGPTTLPAPGTLHPSGMTEAEVEQVIQAVTSYLVSQPQSGSMNTWQADTLRRELRTRVPPLVVPGTAYQPVRLGSMPLPKGEVMLHLTGGSISIDWNGVVVSRSANALHQVTLNPVAGVLMIGEFVASAALAVFLLVSGILLLRNSPRAAGLHRVYALAKLPVAALGGVTLAWVTSELSAGFDRMNGNPTGSGGGMVTLAWVTGVAAALYPAALLVVLSTRTVKDHFAAERALLA